MPPSYGRVTLVESGESPVATPVPRQGCSHAAGRRCVGSLHADRSRGRDGEARTTAGRRAPGHERGAAAARRRRDRQDRAAGADRSRSRGEGFLVLRATGIESEEELPYADPAPAAAAARGPDRRARRACRRKRCAARSGWGSERRGGSLPRRGRRRSRCWPTPPSDQPVLALLDDASWFDRASLDALSVHRPAAARRGRGAAVRGARRARPAVRAARRQGAAGAATGWTTPMREQLLDIRRRPRGRRRRGDRPRGRQPARADRARPRDGATARRSPPAPSRRTWTGWAGCPTTPAALLLLAAADTTTSLAVVGAAAAELGIDGAGARAGRDRWPRARERRRDRVPPPARALGGVPRGAVRGQRARAHLALAAVLTADEDADRRAWHHASAVLGTDDEVGRRARADRRSRARPRRPRRGVSRARAGG